MLRLCLFWMLLPPILAYHTLTPPLDPQPAPLGKRCTYLVDEFQIMDRKCHASFPLVAVTKFRDTFIKTGEPFGLYMPRSMEHILLLMKRSPLMNCERFQIVDECTFFCLDRGLNESIILEKTLIYCFPFHVQLVDDLMRDCLIQNEMGTVRLKDVQLTKRVAIHYTLWDNGTYAHGSRPVPVMGVLLLLLGPVFFVLLLLSSR
ncbi:hypothetical protein KR009_003661 [Drosophila setifemur]|nr:hypothetical protein KR009_003661 [Drosophila setifemur]